MNILPDFERSFRFIGWFVFVCFWALVAFITLVACPAFAAEVPAAFDPQALGRKTPGLRGDKAKLDVVGVSVAQLAELVLRGMEKASYVLSPQAFSDARLISFSFDGSPEELHPTFVDYMRALGYDVTDKGAVYSVDPVPELKEPELPRRMFSYKPKYRDVSYLTSVLGGLFADAQFTSNQRLPPGTKEAAPRSLGGGGANGPQTVAASPGSLSSQAASSDVFLFYGTDAEVRRLKAILPTVDAPAGDVVIVATVFEVQTARKEGSAFKLALSLLSSKFSIGLNSSAAAGDNFLEIKSGTIDAVVSALASDSRFKTISSPVVRSRSGAEAMFTSGSQVPVLGAVVSNGSGQSTQSIDYRDSGVIFKVRPVLHEAVVNLDVSQELSDFVLTTTGVNGSPTLNKRSLVSSLTVPPGTTVILGGLTLERNTANEQGFSFLPTFLDSSAAEETRTEILLVLRVASAGPVAVAGAPNTPLAYPARSAPRPSAP